MIKSIFKFALAKIPRPWLIRGSYWVSPLLAFYYKGNKYEDPIDGRTYRKLLPYGYGKLQRENALAPGSLSLERHRLLWLYLKDHIDFKNAHAQNEKQKILHVAPEQCFYGLFRKSKNLDYTTADLDSPIADIKMDLHQIPFDADTFDVVLCNHVLEHVQDDRQCMREILRVLKPGGWAVMQVPQRVNMEHTDEDPTLTDPKERIRRFGQYDHLRMYGLDYPERLKEVGFQVEEVNFQEQLGKALTERYSIKRELLYVCHKPA